ncbi:hypothetical protein GQS_08495 [Thermococcus sp. 4557]|uniref:DUF835 domain-containing protein n=1 Tax=Thermococcus sp. (strain CGMCC 1.5172 / 4557) TaxID=1042877 RepID=UPI000219EE24|nr:DUF835 domain-containing protein [Thermococcus sp. 4557]AEK73593.1 hypothetical protein GQS_08495 [Thermococcus sp. 4557]
MTSYEPVVCGVLVLITLTLFLTSLRYRAVFLSMHPERRVTYDAVTASFALLSMGTLAFLIIKAEWYADDALIRGLGNGFVVAGLMTFTVGWAELVRGMGRKHEVSRVVEFEEGEMEHIPPGLYICTSPHPEVVKKLLTRRAGLIVSRYPEDMARERFGVERIPVLWLTKVRGENTVNPRRLEYLTQILVDFMSQDDRPKLVLIEGLEYLSVEIGFPALFKFLTTLKDYATIKNAVIIATIGEDVFSEKDTALLLREFPMLKAGKR